MLSWEDNGYKKLVMIEKLKSNILNLLGKLSDNGKLAFKLSYFHNRGRLPRLNNPKNLSEIWIKYVIDGNVNKYAYMADKFAVRQYVENLGYGNILTPLIAVYDSADEIDITKLPERFALKANFGAGHNIICVDKAKLNQDEVKKQVKQWLEIKNYSESERHYNLIPKKIVCEEFIDDGSGGFPVDYKFMCIKGDVVCVLACSGRENGHATYLPYSIKWEPLYDYYRAIPKSIDLLPPPSNLQEMIAIASRLAKGIDLVRIDLYSNGTRIWFGEITLTPAGCIFHRWSDYALDELGKYYLTH